MQKARLYTRHEGYVQCQLCSHRCKIKEGRRGICNVRENREGELFTLVYGQLVAEHVDPIEKKPLFHVLPGSKTYSISTRGCNFRCLHCQNYSISQIAGGQDPASFCQKSSPEEVVSAARAARVRSISYTYVEPTIFFEFAYDCCELADREGLINIFVSNGYMTEETTRQLAPLLTAINIDLKSFSDDFYHRVCGAHLEPVLRTIELMHSLGVWVEVTTLLIPGMNDSAGELEEIADFLVNIDPYIPWHVTAYHPTYKMTGPPPTPFSTLENAMETGYAAGLHHVYAGNIPGSGGEDTKCSCGETVIHRRGFSIIGNKLREGRCPSCSASIAGRWS